MLYSFICILIFLSLFLTFFTLKNLNLSLPRSLYILVTYSLSFSHVFLALYFLSYTSLFPASFIFSFPSVAPLHSLSVSLPFTPFHFDHHFLIALFFFMHKFDQL